jgi:hypothetical protein
VEGIGFRAQGLFSGVPPHRVETPDEMTPIEVVVVVEPVPDLLLFGNAFVEDPDVGPAHPFHVMRSRNACRRLAAGPAQFPGQFVTGQS